ncbi:MAG: hypothetical protein ABIJ09_26175 [Pseudomonadota bacterium]
MADGTGTNFTSSIFTRHLEELEELQSGASSFEETPTYDDDNSSEPGLEWRRQLLEEASTRVKQARVRTLDPSKVYEPGTLLFDPADGKFGRVRVSQAGMLVVRFVSGGERSYGDVTLLGDANVALVSPAKGSKKASRSKAKPAAAAPPAKAAPAKTADVGDINTFIRSNYKTLSNRELARRIGLSEHTIRRKLGEWGLKRDKR